MSSGDRPRAVRQETFENPAFSEANTSIPVTPTVSPERDGRVPPTTSSHGVTRNPPEHVLEAIGARGPTDYVDAAQTHQSRQNESTSKVANGSPSGEELLRRLSLTGARPHPDFEDLDPRAAHPGLTLSGNVISATFCVPYKIGYTTTGEWVGSACRTHKVSI